MVSVPSQHVIIEAQKMKSPLIDWMSETRLQGCTHIQSLIISLDHRDIVIQYYSYINVTHTYGRDRPKVVCNFSDGCDRKIANYLQICAINMYICVTDYSI